MRKPIQFVIALFVLSFNLNAVQPPVQIISSTDKELVIKITNTGWSFKDVQTEQGIAKKIVLPGGVSLMKKGYPDLAKFVIPINVPLNSRIGIGSNVIEVTDDILNVDIAPSKGSITRNIDPATVPFTYNDVYSKNSFYPYLLGNEDDADFSNYQINTGDFYFIRNQKGIALNFIPFRYNPVTKILHVTKEITIRITFNKSSAVAKRDKNVIKFNDDKEFEAIYVDHFINYKNNSASKTSAYTPVNEDGDMLVICEDAFSSKMTPFVQWKNLKGIRTTMVLRSTIAATGITSAQVKTYISNAVSNNPNLKYILLVGDHQQIPASSTSAGPSDNDYVYITPLDHYPDLFIGRFSAQNATDVETQVNKSVNYEKYPQLYGSFYNVGCAIASDQGPGYNNNLDYQHQWVLRSKAQAFTYGLYDEFYDGSQGGTDAAGNPTDIMVQNYINANGAGLITYTGHGSDFSWGTSGFSNSNIANLTNTNKLPFIISVACVNGNFTTNNACFAEAWLRAGTPAAPKGAIATVMSTINQYWDEPMAGQDHMIDVLATNTVSVKRSFAGMAMNGCMFMNDLYSTSGEDMTDTWTVFGDPSLRMTTTGTTPMTVTHPASTSLGTTNINVGSNQNGALICFNVLGTILSTGKIAGTSVNMTFPSLATNDTIYVTATAFNKTPYFGKIIVNSTSTGINNQSVASTNGLVVYPNPATNNLVVKLNDYAGNFSYEILNVIGQLVKTSSAKKVNGINENIDVMNLQDGTYILRVKMDNDVKTIRFIKQ